MKKSILFLAVSTLMAGMLGTGCKSNTEKEAEAEAEAIEATHEAKQDEMIDEQISDNDKAEWENFKNETEAKIKANEQLISDLKLEIKNSNKKYDDAYLKNIDLIEKRNADLRLKINGYENSESDWDSFKSEFNRDMDELGKSINDLTVDNKK